MAVSFSQILSFSHSECSRVNMLSLLIMSLFVKEFIKSF